MGYLTRLAFMIGAGALFAGCGASQPPIGAPGTNDVTELHARSKTFNYTGAEQTFKVPAGVATITVVALGAAGYGLDYCDTDCFGRGGRVHAEIPVTPKETLYVYVGGRGAYAGGGFNGGGYPGSVCDQGSWGGGGASDVREGGDALTDRVLVAAGGGGQGGYGSQGGYYGNAGGNGGGKNGGAGGGSHPNGGYGASQTQGGAGGAPGQGDGSGSPGQPGSDGALGVGGNGGSGGEGQSHGNRGGCGGGGGGGYYGGGGGGGGGGSTEGSRPSLSAGGGGGGSSWAERRAKKFHTWSGWKSAKGNGLVVFSW